MASENCVSHGVFGPRSGIIPLVLISVSPDVSIAHKHMPEPRTWYRDPNHEEFFIPLPDKEHELRLRVRLIKKKIRNSKRKQIKEFFVGLEIYFHDDWETIIEYCNQHEKTDQFHIHNKKRLKTEWGDNFKIPMKISNKRVPASQFRWSKKNLIHYFKYYTKQYIKKER